MKKKTVNMMKGLGVAMAVGSMVAGTVATMNSNSAKTQKTMKKAVFTCLFLIGFKGSAGEDCNLQRIHTQNFLQIPIILINIFEICTQ